MISQRDIDIIVWLFRVNTFGRDSKAEIARDLLKEIQPQVYDFDLIFCRK